MNKILISKCYDPYFNLSYEYQLFNELENETIFYIYINHESIIIGHNQNPYCECNMDKINKNDIKLIRRISGGGAVYHDLGNLNFAFIMPSSKQNLPKQYQVIIDALDALNIKVTKSGRNDLLWNNKKVSGNAYYDDGTNYLHHGTLVFNVDLSKIDTLLQPSPLKLISNATRSVKSRVVNLKEINPNLTMDLLINSLVRSFSKYYNQVTIDEISYQNKPKLYNFYQTKEWLLGMSPNYNVMLDYRDTIGTIRLFMLINNNIIQEIVISADSLQRLRTNLLKDQLIGLSYDEEKINKIIKKFVNSFNI